MYIHKYTYSFNIQIIIIGLLLSSHQFQSFQKIFSHKSLSITRIQANPVTSGIILLKYNIYLYNSMMTIIDGTSYQDITEDEAFLWFDEALIYVRGGSGGSGSSAVKFGKARQVG